MDAGKPKGDLRFYNESLDIWLSLLLGWIQINGCEDGTARRNGIRNLNVEASPH